MLEAYDAPVVRQISLRQTVIDDIVRWAADPGGGRVLFIQGSPGTGKSTTAKIVSELGTIPCNPVYDVAATYFCTASDRATINPHTFVAAISSALARRYSAFAEALLTTNPSKQIHIAVEQHIASSPGAVLQGVVIKEVKIAGDMSVDDAFTLALVNPLSIMAAKHKACLLILVDALDEAARYDGKVNIVDLLAGSRGLPASVRFVVMSRPDDRIRRKFEPVGVRMLNFDSADVVRATEREIAILVKGRLEASGFKGRFEPSYTHEQCALDIGSASGNNFLYAENVLAVLEVSKGPIRAESVSKLPATLLGLYVALLDAVVRDRAFWHTGYAKILGTLAVAREPLDEHVLAQVSNLPTDELRQRIDDLRHLLIFTKLPGSKLGRYSIFHQSFVEFLRNAEIAEVYWCDPIKYHKAYVAFAQSRSEGWSRVDWERQPDYVLRNIMHHVKECESDWASQLEATLTPAYFRAKWMRWDTDASFDDLGLAIRGAAEARSWQKLLRWSWIYAGFRDIVAQNTLPQLVPLYAKLKHPRADSIYRELEAGAGALNDEGASRRALVLELAEEGRIEEAVQLSQINEQPHLGDNLLYSIGAVVARSDPKRALALLPTGPSRWPKGLCLALAAHDGYLDLAIERASDEPTREAIMLRVAARQPQQAFRMAMNAETFVEDVAGFKMVRGRSNALSKLAVALVEVDRKLAIECINRIETRDVRCGARAAIAGPLLAFDEQEACDCVAKIDHPGLLFVLAASSLLSFGECTKADSFRRRAKHELQRIRERGEYDCETIAVDIASQIDLARIASSEAARVLGHETVRCVVEGIKQSSTREADRPEEAAEFLAEWLGLYGIAEALQFVSWVGEKWGNSHPRHGACVGLTKAVARMEGLDGVLRCLNAHPELKSHDSYVAVVDLLAKRGFDEAAGFIDKIDPRFSNTRAILIDHAQAGLTPDDNSNLLRLLSQVPKYVDSAHYLEREEELLRLLNDPRRDKYKGLIQQIGSIIDSADPRSFLGQHERAVAKLLGVSFEPWDLAKTASTLVQRFKQLHATEQSDDTDGSFHLQYALAESIRRTCIVNPAEGIRLWRDSLGQSDINERDDLLQEISKTIALSDCDLALDFIDEFVSGSDPRAVYIRSRCLKEVAITAAARDWKRGLRVSDLIEDVLVRGAALEGIIDLRSDAHSNDRPDELRDVFDRALGINDEESRRDALAHLVLRNIQNPNWSTQLLADVVEKIALSSRETALELFTPLVALLDTQGLLNPGEFAQEIAGVRATLSLPA